MQVLGKFLNNYLTGEHSDIRFEVWGLGYFAVGNRQKVRGANKKAQNMYVCIKDN